MSCGCIQAEKERLEPIKTTQESSLHDKVPRLQRHLPLQAYQQ